MSRTRSEKKDVGLREVGSLQLSIALTCGKEGEDSACGIEWRGDVVWGVGSSNAECYWRGDMISIRAEVGIILSAKPGSK